MTIISKLKKTFVASSVAGMALGLVGCGPDYALFKIKVRASTVSATDRQPVESCRMSIVDEKGELVLNDYLLKAEHDSEGKLIRGCGDASTPSNIGDFSYSTSRTSGSLTFIVEGRDNDPTHDPVLKGETTGAVKKFPPEVELSLELTKFK